MEYVSTRGGSKKVSSAEAIKNGLCEDGGLYMPESIPALTEEDLKKLAPMDYAHRAAYIIGLFLTDYDKDTLEKLCMQAYRESAFGKHPAPVAPRGDLDVLELWHGPTCAFKDMALQLTPLLLSEALRMTGEKRTAEILVATSGDTGKAALEGFRDVDQTRILVFYPKDGVSALQKRQMMTQEGNNVGVCGIEGNFDDAQSAVKTIFADKELCERIGKRAFFSSANSINWGRLVPQVVYYVSAYLDMLAAGRIKAGEPINVCVPTGNFGDIFAGYIAKRMGVKIDRLICASNSNKVLTDFFETGVYDRRREFFTTISPSMDILVSSNLERMLYLICGAEKTKGYMDSLKKDGCYRISPEELEELRSSYTGMWQSEKETSDTIRRSWEKFGYLCDPHTAVAIGCAEKAKLNGRTLVLSTASPYKFTGSVCRALGKDPGNDELKAVDVLNSLTAVPIPEGIEKARKGEVRFTDTVTKDRIKDTVLDFIEK